MALLAEGFRALWSELAPIGRADSGGYRRFALTETDAALRTWFAGHCERLGLRVEHDTAGNQWGWWDVAGDRPAIVTGSHLDSVPDGGAFDGPLGVVSGLLAVEQLKAEGYLPSAPMAVVNFSDEEGARFGLACLGSRILTGAVSPSAALALTDDAGLTLADALRAAGRDPQLLERDPALISRIGAFIELHVEQGRNLIDQGRPLAVATDIWPHGRWRIDLPGRADHAGTTRLEDRSDALVSFGAVVLEARWAAAKHDAVATIGKIRVTPGGINAIPSEVTAWLDARGPEESSVTAVVDVVSARVTELGGTLTRESWTPATPFDVELRERLSALIDAPAIGTGAGHDAGILANAGVPSAMIFVRNPTGTSHSPAEFAEESDCLLGVAALVTVLRELTS